MSLVLKSLDDDGIERRIDAGATFSIGRGTDNDLVLVDPSREVSKTHCRIETEDGRFVLIDLSINGVTIDGQSRPMGPGSRHTLASGDVFLVGPRRFAVEIAKAGEDSAPAEPFSSQMSSLAPSAPGSVSHILDGFSEGAEARASGGVTGEADRWLSALPLGAADATMRLPMGWDEPPATSMPADGAPLLPPDVAQPASEFANRSEHLAAPNSVVQVPRAQQLIPTNWLEDDESPAAQAMPIPSPQIPAPSTPPPRAPMGADARRAFAEGARLDSAGLAGVPDADLMRRCGEALRAVLDGLDALEAAQAVAERDCKLQVAADGALWTDFFATNRDPLLSMLVEPQPPPAQVLAQRAAALADRQRALGRAVADAAALMDSTLAPAVIEGETRGRFRRGPLASLAAWERYSELHAELVGKGAKEGVPSFLVLLRKCFSRVLQKRA